MSKVNKVDKLVNGLLETLEQAKNFTIEQAPDVAKQLVLERQVELKYELTTSALASLLLLTIILVLAGIALKTNIPDDARGIAGVVSLFLTVLFWVCGVGGTLNVLRDMARLKVAPKVFLLRALRRMLE